MHGNRIRAEGINNHQAIAPIGLVLYLPPGIARFGASVAVSRVWQPIASGASADTRRLGVGLASNFTRSQDGLANYRTDLSGCTR